MSLNVVRALADAIPNLECRSPLGLIWHGGEPLLAGRQGFIELLSAFEPLRRSNRIDHYIQTNATLIDDGWCDIFRRYDIDVGVSIDGPPWANSHRIDWKSREAFARIRRGIDRLKDARVPFSVIAVVTRDSLCRGAEVYAFFQELGCTSLGINIEEQIGIHTSVDIPDELVTNFWRDVLDAWERDPTLEVRELRNVLWWMLNTLENIPDPFVFDLFPSIGWNGDVVLLSPELLGADVRHHFIVGNILREDFATILSRGKSAPYVIDYLAGVDSCLAGCPYFSSCRGGQAANKFFELGTTRGTETKYCRHTTQIPLDVILQKLDREAMTETIKEVTGCPGRI